jgi:branched-chain amino acid transport system permease protein
LFLDSPSAALVYGCAVALLGTGFTLVHVSSDFPHLGLIHYSALGAYVGYTIAELLGISPYLGLPLAFLVGGGVNAGFYLTVVAAMQRRGMKDVMLAVSTLVGSFVMVSLINIYTFWFNEATGAYSRAFSLRDARAPIASFVVLTASVLLLRRLLSGTRLGAAVRGSAESRELASVCGVDPFRVQAFSWFVAGGLAAVWGKRRKSIW